MAGDGDPCPLRQHPGAVRLIKFHMGRPVPLPLFPGFLIVAENTGFFVIQLMYHKLTLLT